MIKLMREFEEYEENGDEFYEEFFEEFASKIWNSGVRVSLRSDGEISYTDRNGMINAVLI